MHVAQSLWGPGETPGPAADADLVLIHGSRASLQDADLAALAKAAPKATVVGCSGAGEIMGTALADEGIVVTSIRFDRASVEAAMVEQRPDESDQAAGARLVAQLPAADLKHVIVLSDGLTVNGTELVEGMTGALPPEVSVTGGLAGDGDSFEQTEVVFGTESAPGRIVAIGLYGPVQVGYGSLGGWDPFGPQRTVTRAEGNVLYELDGRPALELYKDYLGSHAEGLPATGLLFPLYLPEADGGQGVVRTILAVDDEANTMTFAGDIPEGAPAQLMKANFDRLIDGAETAAKRSDHALDGMAEFAFLVSCVGRRLVLKQRVEDELDAVQSVVGDAVMAGFYSYGEICPSAPGADCRLHNQTMTVTTLRER